MRNKYKLRSNKILELIINIKKVLWNKCKLNNVLIELENKLELEKLVFKIKEDSCWMYLLDCIKKMQLWKDLFNK